MAGLSKSRNTAVLGTPADGGANLYYPVEASTTIYLGGIVAIDSNGYAVPAQAKGSSPLDSMIVVGIAREVYYPGPAGLIPYGGGAHGPGVPGTDAVNQSSTILPDGSAAGAAGAMYIRVERCIAQLDADSSIVQAVVGKVVFAKDDHTVQATDGSGTLVAAGTLVMLGDIPTAPAFGTSPVGCYVDLSRQGAAAT